MNVYILSKKVPNTDGEGPGQNNKGWGVQGHRLRIRGAFVQIPNGASYLRVVVRDRVSKEVFIDESFEAIDPLTEDLLNGDFTFPVGLDVVPFDVAEIGLDVYVRGGDEEGPVADAKYTTVRVAVDIVSAPVLPASGTGQPA